MTIGLAIYLQQYHRSQPAFLACVELGLKKLEFCLDAAALSFAISPS